MVLHIATLAIGLGEDLPSLEVALVLEMTYGNT
jgi:hypothetical protein